MSLVHKALSNEPRHDEQVFFPTKSDAIKPANMQQLRISDFANKETMLFSS